MHPRLSAFLPRSVRANVRPDRGWFFAGVVCVRAWLTCGSGLVLERSRFTEERTHHCAEHGMWQAVIAAHAIVSGLSFDLLPCLFVGALQHSGNFSYRIDPASLNI